MESEPLLLTTEIKIDKLRSYITKKDLKYYIDGILPSRPLIDLLTTLSEEEINILYDFYFRKIHKIHKIKNPNLKIFIPYKDYLDNKKADFENIVNTNLCKMYYLLSCDIAYDKSHQKMMDELIEINELRTDSSYDTELFDIRYCQYIKLLFPRKENIIRKILENVKSKYYKPYAYSLLATLLTSINPNDPNIVKYAKYIAEIGYSYESYFAYLINTGRKEEIKLFCQSCIEAGNTKMMPHYENLVKSNFVI